MYVSALIVFLGIDTGIIVLDYFRSCFSLKELSKGKYFKMKIRLKVILKRLRCGGHICNPSILEAEAGGS